MNIVIGADIGGSHISAGLIDLSGRCLLNNSFLKRKVDATASKQEIISSWASVILELVDAAPEKITHIGLALPGPMDYENGIILIKDQKKFRSLYRVNVKDELRGAMNKFGLTIHIENDALCFLKGELFHKLIEQDQNALGLTLGTGLGSTTCINGEFTDANLWCQPFRSGIMEDYLSTQWFITKYHTMTGKYIRGVKELLEQDQDAGLVASIFEEFGDNLCNVISLMCGRNKFDHIFLGGNISNAFYLFSHRLTSLKVEVHRASLGEKSAILGAAASFNSLLKSQSA
ncbi:ROK family protein [Pedobacter petrophilus]|uniref:ROK family protein n=1 Tax=Pedobacter petrophilus TaxID=1908241 RepID=A0A7K0FTJ0_9SPHI|nr:ROK family protein [Pedobacter petrophilus]MRX74701.1 ROK family protein [Pedobacter petrophilus]